MDGKGKKAMEMETCLCKTNTLQVHFFPYEQHEQDFSFKLHKEQESVFQAGTRQSRGEGRSRDVLLDVGHNAAVLAVGSMLHGVVHLVLRGPFTTKKRESVSCWG